MLRSSNGPSSKLISVVTAVLLILVLLKPHSAAPLARPFKVSKPGPAFKPSTASFPHPDHTTTSAKFKPTPLPTSIDLPKPQPLDVSGMGIDTGSDFKFDSDTGSLSATAPESDTPDDISEEGVH
jgi:hypothetical protein